MEEGGRLQRLLAALRKYKPSCDRKRRAECASGTVGYCRFVFPHFCRGNRKYWYVKYDQTIKNKQRNKTHKYCQGVYSSSVSRNMLRYLNLCFKKKVLKLKTQCTWGDLNEWWIHISSIRIWSEVHKRCCWVTWLVTVCAGSSQAGIHC